jgi:hypothetical protein
MEGEMTRILFVRWFSLVFLPLFALINLNACAPRTKARAKMPPTQSSENLKSSESSKDGGDASGNTGKARVFSDEGSQTNSGGKSSNSQNSGSVMDPASQAVEVGELEEKKVVDSKPSPTGHEARKSNTGSELDAVQPQVDSFGTSIDRLAAHVHHVRYTLVRDPDERKYHQVKYFITITLSVKVIINEGTVKEIEIPLTHAFKDPVIHGRQKITEIPGLVVDIQSRCDTSKYSNSVAEKGPTPECELHLGYLRFYDEQKLAKDNRQKSEKKSGEVSKISPLESVAFIRKPGLELNQESGLADEMTNLDQVKSSLFTKLSNAEAVKDGTK